MTSFIDPEDGENLLVRYFLASYRSADNLSVGYMKNSMSLMSRPYPVKAWPDWVDEMDDDAHVTKLAAQNWLRYLFSLENKSDDNLFQHGYNLGRSANGEDKIRSNKYMVLRNNPAFTVTGKSGSVLSGSRLDDILDSYINK